MTKRPRPLRVPVDEVPRRSAIGLPPATVEAAPERSEPEVPRASRPPATTRAEPDLMTPSAAPNAPASNPPASNPPASNPPPAPLSAAPLSLGQPLSAQRTTVDMRPPTRAEPSAEVDDTAVPDISSQSGEEEPAATLSAATSESATLSTASGSATLDTADDAPPEAPTPEPTLPLGEAAPALAAGDVGAFEDEQTLPANASLSGGTRPSAPSMPSAASAPPVSAPPVSAPPPVSLKPSVPATASAPDEAAAAAASPAEAPLAPTPEPSEPPPSALPSEPTEPALRLAAVDPDQVETAERTQPESAKSPVVEETPAVRQTSAVIIRGMVSVSSSVGMVDDATAFEDEATPSDSHPAMMSDESDEDLLLEERATQPLSDPPASIEEPTNEGADQPLELAVSDSDAAESFEAESLADSDIEALAPSTKVEEPALEPALEAALEAVPEAGPSSGEMSLDDELLELDEEEQEDRLSSRPPPPPAGEAKAPEEAPKARRRQWFETFFSDDYLRTVQPPSDKNVAREVDFIERSLGLAAGASILDVGCGLGLHALELSKRGYVVVGLDLSESMLARARSEAKDLGLGATFIQGDMREMTFDFAFDAVLCWGTSFGYFDDEMNRQTIARLYQALKPKGTLLLDIVNRDHVIQQQPNLVWFEGDGCVCMEESKFNYFQSRLQVKRTVILDDGRQRENSYSMRLYSPHEVGKLLHVQGFRVAEFSGRLATPGVFFGATSPQMMILAERRMEATKPAMKEPPAPPPPAPNGAAPAAPAVPGAAPVAPAIPGAPSVPAVPAVPPASSAAAPAVPSRPPPPPAPDEGE